MNLWDNTKRFNLYVLRILEKDMKKYSAKKVFKEIAEHSRI